MKYFDVTASLLQLIQSKKPIVFSKLQIYAFKICRY